MRRKRCRQSFLDSSRRAGFERDAKDSGPTAIEMALVAFAFKSRPELGSTRAVFANTVLDSRMNFLNEIPNTGRLCDKFLHEFTHRRKIELNYFGLVRV